MTDCGSSLASQNILIFELRSSLRVYWVYFEDTLKQRFAIKGGRGVVISTICLNKYTLIFLFF